LEGVTDILLPRMQSPPGLSRMVALSLVAHGVIGAAFLFMPAAAVQDTAPGTVMTISLGGAPGPRSGGMTAISSRAVQAPPEVAPKRPSVASPAAKTPEMALPSERTKPRQTRVRDAPPDARAATPARGREVQTGDATIETGARGAGFGLTTGGGGTNGYLDVGNFCCPEYLSTMVQLIQRNWNAHQQVAGETLVRFTVQRDGRLSDIEVERASGYFALDQTAQRALLLTRQLPPLPAQYTEPQLTVHLIFRYER
jgi:TonB family protein